MKLLHISDIHYRKKYPRAEDGYQGMLCRMQDPLIPLGQCLRKALSEEEVDAVVITGDLTEDGSPEDYRELRDYIRRFTGEIPLFVTPGNHDSKEALREGWLGEAASGAPCNYGVELGDCLLLSLDSSSQGVPDGKLAEESLSWLRETLELHRDRPVILMTHHHLIPGQAEVKGLPEWQELKEVLSGSSVSLILCGHTHHQHEGRFAGILCETAAGLSFCGEGQPDGTVEFSEVYGYNLYSLQEGRLLGRRTEIFSTGRLVGRIHKDRIYE